MKLSSKHFDENTFGCPYDGCDYEVECDPQDQHVDEVADDVTRECPVCHRHFQLRCTEVALYFESTGAEFNESEVQT